MTTAHQRRAYPWYKEAPATFLSDRAFKSLSFAEKGLFTALRWEYWVNGPLPTNLDELDAIIGAPSGTCAPFITKAAGHFIEEMDGALHFPDLKHQREKQVQQSEGRSDAGRKGGKASASRRACARTPERTDQAQGQAPAQAPYSNSHSSSPSDSTSSLQEAEKDFVDDEFIRQYNDEERRSALRGMPYGAV